MFELNLTLVIFIISFLVFMALLNQVLLKPVGTVLTRRKAKIQSDIDAGKKARADAQAVLDRYHQHLSEVRGQAQAIINETVEKASYHRSQRLSQLKADGNKRLEQAKSDISMETSQLLGALAQQEVQLVEAIAQKLVGEPVVVQLDTSTVRRALEEAR